MKLTDLKLNVDEEIIKLRIENLANEKFIEFRLTDWKFVWGAALNQLGVCNYTKKYVRMSLPLAVSNLNEAVDTLLHEIAHALTPKCGHNKEWKEACIKLGAAPKRLAPASVTARSEHLPTKQSYKIYKLTCPCCSFYTTKNRKASRSSSCPKCSNTYNEQFKLIWSEPKKIVYNN